MNTIYLVTATRYIDDNLLEGFATDEESLKEIVLNHYLQDPHDEGQGVTVEVDMKAGQVVMKDPDDGYSHTYRIITVSKATKGGRVWLRQ